MLNNIYKVMLRLMPTLWLVEGNIQKLTLGEAHLPGEKVLGELVWSQLDALERLKNLLLQDEYKTYENLQLLQTQIYWKL